jgi:hypothetical protein
VKMHLRVTNADGSAADVTVSAADFVGFESTFNRSVAKFQEEFRLTDMYWLAWHSLRRSNPKLPEFTEWIEANDPDVEFSDDTGEIVPLESSPQLGG